LRPPGTGHKDVPWRSGRENARAPGREREKSTQNVRSSRKGEKKAGSGRFRGTPAGRPGFGGRGKKLSLVKNKGNLRFQRKTGNVSVRAEKGGDGRNPDQKNRKMGAKG